MWGLDSILPNESIHIFQLGILTNCYFSGCVADNNEISSYLSVHEHEHGRVSGATADYFELPNETQTSYWSESLLEIKK